MSVDIAVGDAHILKTSYPFDAWTDAVNNVAITAADPSNPRRSIIIAWIDLSVSDSSNSNNPGMLKFASINGTAAGSPSDPSDGTIQTAIGSGNPFIKLARVQLPAATSPVVNAYITDLRETIKSKAQANTDSVVTASIANNAVTTAKLATGTNFTPALAAQIPYKFLVYRFAGWTPANGSFAKVPFDTKEYDTGTNFDTTNSRFVVPVGGDGFYRFSTAVTSQGINNGAVLGLGLYKNGAEIKRFSMQDQIYRASSTSTTTLGGTSPLISFTAGDYIEIFYQGNGTTGSVGAVLTWFSGELVSKT